MFQASLCYDDFGSPLDIVDGGIFFGRSSIVPVAHRLLHTQVMESRERLAIITRERFADGPSGLDHRPGLSDAQVQAEIDALDDYLLDYAVLTIDAARHAVRYRASPVISVPVYLAADRSSVAMDWDYARLLRDRPVIPVRPVVLAQVAGFSTYGPTTVVAGLYRSTADATLVATPAGVTAELPDPVVHDGPQAMVVGADIERHLFDTVSAIIAARPIDPARTAVEISGGMDSALTALAAASVAGPGLLSTGAQFGGAMGAAQAERRRLLVAHGTFDDLSVPAERFAPFAAGGPRRLRCGVLPEDENYPELFEPIFAMLARGGFDSLVAGFGGDELYPTFAGEDGATAPALPATSPLLTARGAADARGAIGHYPVGWLQESCWQSSAGRAQRLLQCGLWPIYPYINVALARFVSRLPRAYRRDRALLRRTLTGVLGDPLFEHDYVKERFGPVARRGINENRDYLADLVARSPLSRLDGIDGDAIRAALATDADALDRDTYEALFRAMKVFSFFQSDD